MNHSDDDRPPLAVAMQWVSRVTSISAEMVVPALLGYWVGEWLGATVVFLTLGATIGLVGGTWHLIRLTQPPGPTPTEEPPPEETPPEETLKP